MSGRYEGRIETHQLKSLPGTEDKFLTLTARIRTHLGLPLDCTGEDWLKATFRSDGILISPRHIEENELAPFERPVEIVRL